MKPKRAEQHQDRDLLKLEDILLEHTSRYPLLLIQDLYKFLHQGALGSEHAVKDRESARKWLDQELQHLQEGPQESIFDPISPNGEIVRVNLRPYLQAGGDVDDLLEAFVRTANEYRGSKELLQKFLAYVRRMVKKGKLTINLKELDQFIAEMEKEGFPAVHHSSIYEEAYRPAYRVIAAMYLPESANLK